MSFRASMNYTAVASKQNIIAYVIYQGMQGFVSLSQQSQVKSGASFSGVGTIMNDSQVCVIKVEWFDDEEITITTLETLTLTESVENNLPK